MNAQVPVPARHVYNKLREPDVIRALAANHGLLVQSAMALGCSRQALSNFVKKRPHLNKFRDEQTEIVLDVAESNVISGIYSGDEKYTRWFLDRKGKGRGYVTRSEMSGPDGQPVPFTMIERVPPFARTIDGEVVDADSQR
jgi:hypothetical protein